MGNACCARPMALSVINGTDEIVRQLREQPELLSNPKPTAFLGLNDSALHLAAESKSLEAMQQIFNFLAGADQETLQAALRPYCRRRHLQLPSGFVAAARLAANMANNKGQTPLMYACYSDCPEMVKLLMEQGAEPWVGDNCGCRNALHYAAMAGSAACVDALMKHIMPHMLVQRGVRYINSRSLSGLTPLHYCVFFAHEETLRALLQYEPNINAASSGESYDTYGAYDIYSTPLHFAALQDSTALARLLLLHYARRRRLGTLLDPRLRADSAGKLPWQVTRSRALASLLHPAAPLNEVLGREGEEALMGLGDGAAAALGPPALAALAAAALRQKLLAAVEVIERECVEEAALQRQQTGRASGLLACSTPRRGNIAAAAPNCSGGARDFFRLASRGLNRSPSRRPPSRRRLAGGAAVMPASPRRAPTLDRQPHPSDYAAVADGTAEASPSLVHRSRGAPSPALNARASYGSANSRANGRINGNGDGNGRGSMPPGGRGCSPPLPPQLQRPQLPGGGSNGGGDRVGGDGAENGGGAATWHPGLTSPNGGDPFPPFGGGSGTLNARSASLTAGPRPFAAAAAAAEVEAGSELTGTLPGGASPTTPYAYGRAPPTEASPLEEVIPAGGSPRGDFDDGLRCSTVPYVGGSGYGNVLSPAASLLAGSCVDFDAAAAAVTRAAVDGPSGGALGTNGNAVDGGGGDDDDDDGFCAVCFTRPEAVASATCHHGLCTACAGELCRALVSKPLLCPFCRRPVADFVRLVRPAPAAGMAAGAAASARRRSGQWP